MCVHAYKCVHAYECMHMRVRVRVHAGTMCACRPGPYAYDTFCEWPVEEAGVAGMMLRSNARALAHVQAALKAHAHVPAHAPAVHAAAAGLSAAPGALAASRPRGASGVYAGEPVDPNGSGSSPGPTRVREGGAAAGTIGAAALPVPVHVDGLAASNPVPASGDPIGPGEAREGAAHAAAAGTPQPGSAAMVPAGRLDPQPPAAAAVITLSHYLPLASLPHARSMVKAMGCLELQAQLQQVRHPSMPCTPCHATHAAQHAEAQV